MIAGRRAGDHTAHAAGERGLAANASSLGYPTLAVDIANAAVYLASDESHCVTGHTLVVDQGSVTSGIAVNQFHVGAGEVIAEAGRSTRAERPAPAPSARLTGAMARVVVASDTHLSPHVPSADRQWDVVLAELEQRPPDLLVHAGDLTVHGATDPADLTYARRRLDESPVPWRAIAGNHDIGDMGVTREPVNEERRARYAEQVGDSTWATDVAGWHLVGVDVQTLASDLPAASALWAWLADALAAPAPTILFSHRPLRPPVGGAADDPGRYLTGDVRARVTALLDEHDVRTVVSGHVHQWMLVAGERQHVWAPSAWASIPELVQPTIGEKVTGVVELELRRAPTCRPSGCSARPVSATS